MPVSKGRKKNRKSSGHHKGVKARAEYRNLQAMSEMLDVLEKAEQDYLRQHNNEENKNATE